jgi:hypothetical protein
LSIKTGEEKPMRFLKDNGLTLALMLLFFGSLVGMLLTGWQVENEELVRHSQAPVSIVTYFFGHAFQSALFVRDFFAVNNSLGDEQVIHRRDGDQKTFEL